MSASGQRLSEQERLQVEMAALLRQKGADKAWLAQYACGPSGAEAPEAAAVWERLEGTHRRFEELVSQQRAGWDEAVTHQEVRRLGPPCVFCGEYLRTPKAKLCASCWRHRGTRLEGLLFHVRRALEPFSPLNLLKRKQHPKVPAPTPSSRPEAQKAHPSQLLLEQLDVAHPRFGQHPRIDVLVRERRKESLQYARILLFVAAFLGLLLLPAWDSHEWDNRLLYVAAVGWPLSSSLKHVWWWHRRRSLEAFPGVRRRARQLGLGLLVVELGEAFQRYTPWWIGDGALAGPWLLLPRLADLEVHRLDDFAWVYRAQGRNALHRYILYLRDGRHLELETKEWGGVSLLARFEAHAPWVPRDFDEHLHTLATKDFSALVRMVDARRQR